MFFSFKSVLFFKETWGGVRMTREQRTFLEDTQMYFSFLFFKKSIS